jgi:hypothetical protein
MRAVLTVGIAGSLATNRSHAESDPVSTAVAAWPADRVAARDRTHRQQKLNIATPPSHESTPCRQQSPLRVSHGRIDVTNRLGFSRACLSQTRYLQVPEVPEVANSSPTYASNVFRCRYLGRL